MKRSFGAPDSSGNRRRLLARSARGQSLVELAVGVPVLLMLLTGSVMFASAFNQEIELTYATNAGAQLLAISRGQTTDPCATTSGAVYSAAPSLTQSSIKFTIVLNGTKVASSAANPSCSGDQSDLVESETAEVTTTYPCNLNIFGFKPSCSLSAQTSVLIQ